MTDISRREFLKDGMVWREEQSATYTAIDPKIPDYDPRDCQKNCYFSQRMYDGSRIRYPLKRMGERGEGTWKRMTWDEALKDIADRMIVAGTFHTKKEDTLAHIDAATTVLHRSALLRGIGSCWRAATAAFSHAWRYSHRECMTGEPASMSHG